MSRQESKSSRDSGSGRLGPGLVGHGRDLAGAAHDLLEAEARLRRVRGGLRPLAGCCASRADGATDRLRAAESPARTRRRSVVVIADP